MKTSISTDQYMAALAMVHMETDLRAQSDKYGKALEELFEIDDKNDNSIWDYLFEEDTPSKILGDWLKDNNIQVTGVEHGIKI